MRVCPLFNLKFSMIRIVLDFAVTAGTADYRSEEHKCLWRMQRFLSAPALAFARVLTGRLRKRSRSGYDRPKESRIF